MVGRDFRRIREHETSVPVQRPLETLQRVGVERSLACPRLGRQGFPHLLPDACGHAPLLRPDLAPPPRFHIESDQGDRFNRGIDGEHDLIGTGREASRGNVGVPDPLDGHVVRSRCARLQCELPGRVGEHAVHLVAALVEEDDHCAGDGNARALLHNHADDGLRRRAKRGEADQEGEKQAEAHAGRV